MYQLFKKFVTVFFLVAILCLPYFVFADDKPATGANPLTALSTVGTGAGYAQNVTEASVFATVKTVITAGLSIIGVLFLVLMIYGGFLWMTDRGNEAQVKKAQKLIEAAVIGIIIVVSAYAITQFVNTYIIKGGTT